jgi:uncharacterized protein (DUF302 family)
MEDTGLVSRESEFSVKDTVDRLVAALESAGLSVFARIDHGANALAVGLELRPTELVIYGHPRGGTPLMLDRQSAGIDLPVKALAWEDEDGQVWLTYNSAAWLAERHALGGSSAGAVDAIEAGMAALAAQATSARPPA